MEQVTRRELLVRGGKYAALAAARCRSPAGWHTSRGRRASGIFDELAHLVRGAVVVRGDAAYDQARVLCDTRFDTYKPQAIVFCESLADVQRTVRWARKHRVRIVPRSGGHSYGGYSSTSGVIVDVSRLNGVSLDSSRRAVVGAGARLIDVYDGLWQHRRTVPAGSCPTVGIAGLALGGGVGLASRKYGLTCDNLLEARRPRERDGGRGQRPAAPRSLLGAPRRGRRQLRNRHALRLPHAPGRPGRDVRARVAVVGCGEGRPGLAEARAPRARRALLGANLNAAAGGHARITSAGQFFGSADRLRELLEAARERGHADALHRDVAELHGRAGDVGGLLGDDRRVSLPPQGHLGRSTFKGKSSFATSR